MGNERLVGYIVWYTLERGYGFIKCDDDKPDYFFHKSNITFEEKYLQKFQQVSFLSQKSAKGYVANNINLIRIFGYVAWYDSKKEYGFIFGDDFYSYFVHKNDIEAEEKTLCKHQPVSFLVKKTGKGLAAYDVTKAKSHYTINAETLKQWIDMAQSQAKPFRKASFVYIFQGYKNSRGKSDTQQYSYKIGYSSNPKQRLKSIRQKFRRKSNKPLVNIVLFHLVDTNSPFWLEQILHRVFASKEDRDILSWEWFSLSNDDIEWLLSLHRVDGNVLFALAKQELGTDESFRLFNGRGQ